MPIKIIPFLWYDHEAAEAAALYAETFPESSGQKIAKNLQSPGGTLEIYSANLWGNEFHLMSAECPFSFSPAISFHVACSTQEQVEHIWNRLSSGGKTLMELGEYPFSEYFGWLADKFGVSWQINCVKNKLETQRISPVLLFSGVQSGYGKESLALYTSIFPDSRVESVSHYGEGEDLNPPGAIQHARFVLNGQPFALIESGYPHDFTFTEAISFLVLCENQAEIDYYWEKLSATPEAEACGWLKDRFGVSWQIVPSLLYEMEQTAETARIKKLYQALLQMKKLNISELQQAYFG